MPYVPGRIFKLLGVLNAGVAGFGNVAEELQLPIEQLEETNILRYYTCREVPAQVFTIEVPVDVPPLIYFHRLVVFVHVALSLFDAVEKDDLEAGHTEECHRDAYLKVRTQVRLHILPGEFSKAIVKSLV